MLNFKRVLCLAPHTDDIECGCGGTISKLIKNDVEIFCASFSLAKKSIPKGFSEDCTLNEFNKASKILGIKEENIIIFDFEVREFPSLRQQILEEMVKMCKFIKPDLVILPSSFDTHQDHVVIYQEGFRAFKKISMMGYEVIWNNLSFKYDIFVILDDEHIQKKVDSLNCYISQKVRLLGGAEFLKNLASVRGNQIGVSYAECFECIRLMI